MNIAIARALNGAADKLRAHGVPDARGQAALLLSHALGRDRAFLIAHDDQLLSTEQSQMFDAYVCRRAAGEPPQYITGHQEFFRLDFAVTADVLIPRPETELIIETVLDLFASNADFSFADLGTGSGCIAISLLHERRQAHGTAIDMSGAALNVARQNAVRHQVADRLRFRQSNLFAALPRHEIFDVIVSNPPYIPTSELKTLQREVRHEPDAALDGGPDGLTVIRRLLEESPAFLRPGGYLIFEIGFDQNERLQRLIDPALWELHTIQPDLQGIARTVVLSKKV